MATTCEQLALRLLDLLVLRFRRARRLSRCSLISFLFSDGVVDDKGWANAFILLQGMFNNIMGLKEEERKKGIRADTMQSLLYSWSKESENIAIGKV